MLLDMSQTTEFWISIFLIKKKKFTLFLAVLFHCCAGFSLVVASRAYSLVTVHRLLIAKASLAAEQGLQGASESLVAARGLSSCGSQTLEHRLNSCISQVYSAASGIFLVQGSNSGLLQQQAYSLPVSHLRGPRVLILRAIIID